CREDPVARDAVGEDRAEQHGEEGRGGGNHRRVPERDERLLRRNRVLRDGILLGAEPDVAVIVERWRIWEIDRRPGEPLIVRLERGRHHPVDRKGGNDRPGGEYRVADRLRQSPTLRLGHRHFSPPPLRPCRAADTWHRAHASLAAADGWRSPRSRSLAS